MASKRKIATENLKKVSKQTEDLLKTLSGSAEHLSAKDSSALYGTLGGLIGALAGRFLGTSFGTVVDLATLTALGVVTGTLIYRGRRRIKLERILEEKALINAKTLGLIQQLPKNAPDAMRDSLWLELQKSNELFDAEIKSLMIKKPANNHLLEKQEVKQKQLDSPRDTSATEEKDDDPVG